MLPQSWSHEKRKHRCVRLCLYPAFNHGKCSTQFHCPPIESKSGIILLGISQVICTENSDLNYSPLLSFKMQFQFVTVLNTLKFVKLKQLRHMFCESLLEIVAPCHLSRHNAFLNRWLGVKAAKRPWLNNKCAC